MEQKGAQREPEGAEREQKGAKREPKGAKGGQKGAKREPKGAKGSQKGAEGSPKGTQSEPKGDQDASQHRLRPQGRYLRGQRSQKEFKGNQNGCQNMWKINEKTDSEMEPGMGPKSNGIWEAKTMKTIKRSSFSWFKDI